MQKLTFSIHKIIFSNRGSILVGAVVFSVIMAMAGIGFITATTNSINSETARLENIQAFQAAESGVWMAARWLRGKTDIDTWRTTISTNPFGDTPLDFNGFAVYDTVKFNDDDPSARFASISATVYSNSTRTTFLKRIKYDTVRMESFGKFTTYMGDFSRRNLNPANNDDWGYTMSGETFNGTTFYNRLWIAFKLRLQDTMVSGNPERIIYNGPTYTSKFADSLMKANMAPANHNLIQTPFKIGHFENNYNSGIHFSERNTVYNPPLIAPATEYNTGILDANIFTDKYRGMQDAVNEASGGVNINDLSINNKIDLPFSATDSPAMPTLVFKGDTGAIYTYDSSGTIRSKTFTYDYTLKTLFYSDNHLNVRGTVAGKTTIATKAGKDIIPIGSIVTRNFKFETGTPDLTGPTRDDLIGIAPGRDLRLKKYYLDFYGNTQTVNTYTGASVTYPKLYINASVLALYSDGVTNGKRGGILCKAWDAGEG